VGFFGKYQASPVDIDDGDLARVLLDEQGRVQVSMTGLTANYATLSYEDITVSSTAINLTTIPTTAIRAVITVEGDNVRFKTDGNAPSSTVGHLLTSGDVLILESAADLAAAQFIRETTDATLRVTYQL
jgi:hypothetical protein